MDSSDPDIDRRARTLRRLVPAVVHSLNNALLFVQGTCELEVTGPSSAPLSRRIELLGTTLKRLALLAREPDESIRHADLQTLAGDLALLLGAREFGFETAVTGSGTFRADGRLEETLLATCAAVADSAGDRPRRVRLGARVRGDWIRLWLSAAHVPPEEALEPLVSHARAWGWSIHRHRSASAFLLACRVPALPGAHVATEPLPSRGAQSVLLLFDEGDERELAAMVLEEAGHRVVASAREPEAGDFTIVLVQRARQQRDPGLAARLGARFPGVHLVALDDGLRPSELLDLLRRRS